MEPAGIEKKSLTLAGPLSEFPFLKAALEDYELAIRLASAPGGNRRQSVCFMHDALEFLLYEILLCRDVDIYESGQNTIGFNEALKKCKTENVSLPLLDTIRGIQKRRGDAKHHGQTPDVTEFERIVPAFRALFSVLCFENFGHELSVVLSKKGVYPFHLALYDLYRRARRGQNWKKALPIALRSLIHKRRAIYGAVDDFATHQVDLAENLLSVLESSGSLSVTVEEGQNVSALVAGVRSSFSAGEVRAASEAIGSACSALDFISPTIFDIKSARKLTERLYQAPSVAHAGMWSMVDNEKIRTVLQANPGLVKSFGEPFWVQEDEDSYWTRWEFVLFDGSRWLPFHLDEGFRISSDPSVGLEKSGHRPSNFFDLVAAEFSKAACAYA